MTWPAILQYAVFLGVVIACVRPVGLYLLRVFEGERTFLDPIMRPVERALYRIGGIDASAEMGWRSYALAFALFSLLGAALLFAILMLQAFGPWYDATHQNTPMTWHLALNTAISFATTTTWQAYGGETTMSYLSQALGLTAQNFLAGAAGLAVGVAFIRGLARERTDELGNFWVDVTRALLWVLLPASMVGALVLVWQGVPMNVDPYTKVHTLQGGAQVIAQGPVAALESIKNLGTNGGGFFNVNGAHPYENPTPLTNLLEMLMIAVIPASLTYTFGRMVGHPRQGWIIFWVMTSLFTAALALDAAAERTAPPAIAVAGVDTRGSPLQPGGNMEGKELRFGIHGSVLAAITTSNGATGSYDSMHDSYTPLGGMVPLINMLLGDIVYGGLGSGLYGMLLMVLVSVFVGALMVGHTPRYLGKEVKTAEIKLIAIYMLVGSAAILVFTCLALLTPWGEAGLATNQGAHGLTEVLYAYASAFTNNGQNFAGLNANTLFYNLTTAAVMLIGRFVPATIALALAGSFAGQGRRVATSGTLPTDTLTFAVFLGGMVLIMAGLSHLPALALGPLSEHFAMRR